MWIKLSQNTLLQLEAIERIELDSAGHYTVWFISGEPRTFEANTLEWKRIKWLFDNLITVENT